MDPQEGIGLLPIFEDAALSEPLRGAFVTGLACSIEIYGWIRRREPVRKVFPQFYNVLESLVPCKHFSLHVQRRGSQETTNVYHRLNLSLGRLRPLLHFVTLL